MKTFRHTANIVHGVPWMIEPRTLSLIASILDRHIAGETIPDVRGLGPGEPMDEAGLLSRHGSVDVLKIHGPILPRASMGNLSSPVTGAAEIGEALAQSVASDSKSIVLDIDSPGGSVSGVHELSSEIFAARTVKPITAIANSLAASAAYWIGSAASEFVASPSAEIGSIGVFAMHLDLSQALEADGIRPTIISAGKFKVEGNPYEPLSEEAMAEMQGRADRVYGEFVAAVARGRGVSTDAVRSGYGQGRVVGAKQAVSLGLADRVDTLEGTIARLSTPQARASVMRGERLAADELLAASTDVPASGGGGEAHALDVLAERLMARLAPQISALMAEAPTQDETAETPDVEEEPEPAPLGIDTEALFGALAERMKGSL